MTTTWHCILPWSFVADSDLSKPRLRRAQAYMRNNVFQDQLRPIPRQAKLKFLGVLVNVGDFFLTDV